MAQKIVMINSVCSGSHGRIMADLQQGATAQGMEAIVAFARGSVGENGPCIRIGTAWDVRIHGVKARLLDRQGFGSKAATRRFVRELERIQPDLIHLHNAHGYYLHLPTLVDYVRAKQIPLVWTLHDCWAFTGHCSHYVRANCMRWQSVCGECPLKKEYPTSLWLDNSKGNFLEKKAMFFDLPKLSLAVPSQWLGEQVRQSFLKSHPLHIIPNGVDLSVFSPSASGEKNSKPRALAVASPFDVRKGFADTVALAQSMPEVEFTLVGLTAKQVKGLPQGIVGLERTESRDALLDLYRRADVLVNTTYEDTYPTVNMEAMACGTPVASYAVGGCVEQIPENCGILRPVGDVPGLAEGIRSILARGQGAYASTCWEHSQHSFDRRDCIRAYLELYRSLL